jgi:mercuric ion transport protein
MIRTFARAAHPVVAAVFVACAVVQVFLAGLGVFDDPKAFVTHREFGYLFGWLTLVVLVLALAGRMPRRVTGLSVLLLVLFALQSVLVALRADLPAIAALHPLNGFAILGVGVMTARSSWPLRREAAAPAMVAPAMVAPAAPAGTGAAPLPSPAEGL